jgi:hypothetical protein
MEVGSGQWVVGSEEIKTAHYPLPTARFFRRSFQVTLRRPERMRINHEETKNTKKEQEKTFVLFVSSWLIL